MKKFLFLVVCAASASAGGYWYTHQGRTTALTEKSLAFAPFQRGTMRDVVSATGILETRDILLVGSEMPGAIQHLYGKVNDTVAEGTILAVLDDRKIRLKIEEADNGVRTAKAALAQAEAARMAAAIALKSQTDLESRGGFRSEKDEADAKFKAANAGVQFAEAKVKTAETGLKEAQLALDMIRIAVPIVSKQPTKRDYLILERKANIGQMVGPTGGPLFVLAGDLRNMEIHAQVAEGDINKVRKGLPAIFTLAGFNEEEVEFRGIVRDIRPLANNLKGAVFYDTVIDLANQKDPASGEWRLRPGMTASVDIVRREHKDVWKIPSQAMNFKMDEAYIGPTARARLDEWKKRSDAGLWVTLWTWEADTQSPQPLFVRILGADAEGHPGLKDSEGNEVLQWEPGRTPSAGQGPPRLIIGAPPARAPGIFDSPANFKVS